MLFSEIKPFIRFAHYIPIDTKRNYLYNIPYDHRLFYVLSGHAAVSVESNLYELSQGDVLIIPSGMLYNLKMPDKQVTYLAVNFDYTQNSIDKSTPIPPVPPEEYSDDDRIESVTFSDFTELNDVFHINGMESIAGRLISIEQEFFNKHICYEQIISCMFSEVLIECLRMKKKQCFTGGSETLKSIIGYIYEHYSLPLSNKDIADIYNLHPNYVNSLVKQYTGMSLHQYLLKIRIIHSIEYLNSSDMNIGEIALKCGFSDIYQFSKTFKKFMGISPAKYYRVI